MHITLFDLDKEKFILKMKQNMTEEEIQLFELLIDEECFVENIMVQFFNSILEKSQLFQEFLKRMEIRFTKNDSELEYYVVVSQKGVEIFFKNYNEDFSTKLAITKITNTIFNDFLNGAKFETEGALETYEDIIISYIVTTLQSFNDSMKDVELDQEEHLACFISVFSGGFMYNHLIERGVE